MEYIALNIPGGCEGLVNLYVCVLYNLYLSSKKMISLEKRRTLLCSGVCEQLGSLLKHQISSY